ncbi:MULTISPECIES: LolA family protein [Amniculibacterium]|jgi:outer membrane lipoprotein-sorting protein|uniref:LolA family protein n=1 Tax=Amniculibacterium TaxID=2715289 RepID=UPI000F5AF278|nr:MULTISPECIES: outer membrane lipoprotein carrier protein LolA [Amniculibacterium]
MTAFFKKIILTVSVVGATTWSFAQKIDDKSKTILDAVTTSYNAKKNSYFKFSFGSGTNGKVSKVEPGIYYASGDKYKLKIMGTEQIFDGQKIYNINEEDMEVTIAKPNANAAMFSPINYLSNYRKEYNVSYEGKKMVKGINTDVIKLDPIKSNGLDAVYLYINGAKKQIVKLEQHGKNKDIAVIEIQGYKENQKLSPAMFSFDKNKFKNYIITEL